MHLTIGRNCADGSVIELRYDNEPSRKSYHFFKVLGPGRPVDPFVETHVLRYRIRQCWGGPEPKKFCESISKLILKTQF